MTIALPSRMTRTWPSQVKKGTAGRGSWMNKTKNTKKYHHGSSVWLEAIAQMQRDELTATGPSDLTRYYQIPSKLSGHILGTGENIKSRHSSGSHEAFHLAGKSVWRSFIPKVINNFKLGNDMVKSVYFWYNSMAAIGKVDFTRSDRRPLQKSMRERKDLTSNERLERL